MDRKIPLKTHQHYHLMTKSIAGYVIFNNDREFTRMISMMRFYQYQDLPLSFSHFFYEVEQQNQNFSQRLSEVSQNRQRLIRILAYCLMSTHLHFIVQQLCDDGISRFMNNLLNSYTRYFNTSHHRKGPLWQGRFKSVHVETDEQLLHLTRYLHLNPISAGLVNQPEQWLYSSYREYLQRVDPEQKLCGYEHVLDVNPPYYAKFVEDRKDYQRLLAKIKHLLME